MLRIKGSAERSRSAEHSRSCTCVDRPSLSADEQFHNNAPHRKRLRKKTTACVSLLVFCRIRRGTFPHSLEDDASTTSQTPTTHYTNICVKLTIVTHLSFSKRIAIPTNLSYVLIIVLSCSSSIFLKKNLNTSKPFLSIHIQGSNYQKILVGRLWL